MRRTAPTQLEHDWYSHTSRAYAHLLWLHRRNNFNAPVPCPTGNPTTCPRCQTLTELHIALAEADEQYPTLRHHLPQDVIAILGDQEPHAS
jgi:hypothetical protein